MTSPHTITSWVGEAICMNNELGLGVSSPSTLLVNQDFFAEVRLTYSVKRGGTFLLNVTVFNQELPIRVKLITYQQEVQTDQTEFDLCIGQRDNTVITMKTTALKLGELNIAVETKITNEVKNCKYSEGEGFTDALVRQLRVKPEGVPIEKVQSDFKCIESGTEKFKMSKFEVPSDSERAWVHLTGDIMAPALENIGNLVRLLTGYGEQNMVDLVPNIYLLQYLDSIGQKEQELEKKAKEHIEIGYNKHQICCSFYNDKLISYTDLGLHMSCHKIEAVFNCDDCQQNFDSIDQLSRHCRVIHGNLDCSESGELAFLMEGSSGSCVYSLGQDAKLEKRFQCQKYFKYFTTKVQLKHHMNIHLNLRPYTCGICGKGFTQPTHLNVHKRTHDGSKPYICSVCGKTFAIASNMRKHLAIYDRDSTERK